MRRLLSASMFALFFCSTAFAQSTPAQVTPANATGVQPYATFGGVRENISYSNGNLNLNIPLLSLPGRNGLNFNLSLLYDSKIWNVSGFYENIPPYGYMDYGWGMEQAGSPAGYAGWRFSIPMLYSTSMPVSGCRGDHVVILPDGSKHAFVNTMRHDPDGSYTCYTKTDAMDGSYLQLDRSNSSDVIVYMKDGTQIHFPGEYGLASKIVDTNGNYISFRTESGKIIATDTVGREVTINPVDTNTNTQTISYRTSPTQTVSIVLTYTSVYLNPTFAYPDNFVGSGQRPETYVTQAAAGNRQMLSQITMPDSRTYNFTYNNFGEITKVIYPTGGYTNYDYGVFTGYYQYWSQPSASAKITFREVIKRSVCKDSAGSCSPSGLEVTTYAPSIGGLQQNNYQNTVTFPANADGSYAKKMFTFTTGGGPYYSGAQEQYAYTYQCTSSNVCTQLQQVQTEYKTNGDYRDYPLPWRITTTLGTAVSRVERDYATVTVYVGNASFTALIDNAIAERQYGYDGSLMRTVTSTYNMMLVHIWDRKATEVVTDSSGTVSSVQYEYNNYVDGMVASNAIQHQSFPYRGNLTAVTRKRSSADAGAVTRYRKLDDTGNVLTIEDANHNQTQQDFTDSWSNGGCTPDGSNPITKAYLTKVTSPAPASLETDTSYYSCTGKAASSTDPNAQSTTFVYDTFARLSNVIYPGGGRVDFGYPSNNEIDRSVKITSSLSETDVNIYDGVGRIRQTQLTSDPQGTTYVDTSYDGMGRISSVSNPYRSGSPAYTTSLFDALDRPTLTTQTDGSVISSSYTNNCATVTDEAGKKKKSCTDALGRLTQVFEDPQGVNWETDYTYSGVGDLLCVEQHGGVTGTGCSAAETSDATSPWRVRRFTYDWMSHLITAKNPESGKICYGIWSGYSCVNGYDDNGNLLKKTDANTSVITFSYDSNDRLLSKSYQPGSGVAATQTVTYGYDANGSGNYGKGHRTSMQVGSTSNSASWTYDVNGRVQQVVRTVNGYSKTVSYSYNLDNSVASITYPSGRLVNYTYSGAARPTLIHDVAGNVDYVNTVSYAASGALESAKLGANITLTNTYNSRLQPNRMLAVGAVTLMDRTYNFHESAGDNGNVWGITDSLDNPNSTTRPIGSATFTYDNLNRITGFSTTGTDCTVVGGATRNSGNSYSAPGYNIIDPWGNLTVKTPTKCTAEPLSEIPNNLNQFSGSGRYDAAGNMTSNGTYVFDAENRITSGAGLTFVYDGDGSRVSKTGSTNELYWLGTGSDALAESNASGGLTAEYIFFGGKRIARIDISDPTHPKYYISDHLGSATVIASDTGVPQREEMYYPYGGERWASGTDSNHYKFTGKERDSETGLDYFGARYYGSNMGRWMSPDWSAKPDPVPYSDLHDPQSLNLYGYVRNNPLSRADIDGHDFWDKLNNLVHGNGWKDTPPPPPPPPPAPPQQTPPAANPPAQQNPVNYRPGVPPAAGNLANTVNCIQNCARQPITVTSTNEAIPQHPADSPHGRGQAADLRVRPGTEHEVLGCAAQCGAQFGLDERAHPSAHATGPHVHIQLTPGRNGGRGDLPAYQTPQEEE